MIHKIELTNFKSHSRLCVNFSTGLNVITGDNGAGKSTILKAIVYALFGASAAGSKQHLTSWGNEDKMNVTLTTTINGKLIEIFRSFDKSLVSQNSNILASGNTPCTKWVEQELGLDVKTFKHLLYASQGETQALLKMGASDLQRKIESITKLDGIDLILSFLSEDLSVLNGKLSSLPEPKDLKQLELDCSELEKLVDLKQNLIKQREQMSIELKSALANRRAEYTEMEAELKKSRTAKTTYEALNASLDRTKEDLEDLESEAPESSSKELAANIHALESYISDREKKVRESDSNEKLIAKLTANFEEARDVQKDFEQTHAHRFAQRAELVENHNYWSAGASETKNYLELLQKQETECPTCNRPYEDAAHTAEHLIQLESAENTYNFNKHKCVTAKEELDLFDSNTRRAYTGDVERERTLVNQQLVKAQDNLLAARLDSPVLDKSHVTGIKDAIQAARGNLDRLKQAYEQSARYERQHDSLVSQLVRMIQELEKVEVAACEWSEADLTAAEQDLTFLQNQVQQAIEELADARCEFQEATMNHKRHAEERAKATQEMKLRQQVEKDQAQRKELQKYLRDNRSRMMDETWGSITALTSGYTSEITEGLIHGLTRDESGDFYVQEGEFNIPVSELSGARQAIVGMCLSLALGRAFYGNNSFILLDEVDSAASDYNSAAIAATLSGLDTQVIMVSHRQGVGSSATNVIVL